MTSFSIAAAPLLLALVPCVFAHVKTPATSIVSSADENEVRIQTAVEDRAPWWKPSALGIDNYS